MPHGKLESDEVLEFIVLSNIIFAIVLGVIAFFSLFIFTGFLFFKEYENPENNFILRNKWFFWFMNILAFILVLVSFLFLFLLRRNRLHEGHFMNIWFYFLVVVIFVAFVIVVINFWVIHEILKENLTEIISAISISLYFINFLYCISLIFYGLFILIPFYRYHSEY